jgi:hypothetical protein
VRRSAITAAQLAGGWRHPALYLLSSTQFRIASADGTTWAFGVSRFYRRHPERAVRVLGVTVAALTYG